LAEGCGISEQVKEEKLGNVAIAVITFDLSERVSDEGGLLGNNASFLGCCLALPDLFNDFTKFQI